MAHSEGQRGKNPFSGFLGETRLATSNGAADFIRSPASVAPLKRWATGPSRDNHLACPLSKISLPKSTPCEAALLIKPPALPLVSDWSTQ